MAMRSHCLLSKKHPNYDNHTYDYLSVNFLTAPRRRLYGGEAKIKGPEFDSFRCLWWAFASIWRPAVNLLSTPENAHATDLWDSSVPFALRSRDDHEIGKPPLWA